MQHSNNNNDDMMTIATTSDCSVDLGPPQFGDEDMTTTHGDVWHDIRATAAERRERRQARRVYRGGAVKFYYLYSFWFFVVCWLVTVAMIICVPFLMKRYNTTTTNNEETATTTTTTTSIDEDEELMIGSINIKMPTPMPTRRRRMPTTAPSSLPSVILSDFNDVQEWILEQDYSLESSFDTTSTSTSTASNSAQRMAAKLMMSEELPSNTTTTNDRNIEWKERNAMAVLYYATTTNGTSWTEQYDFISSNNHICQWYTLKWNDGDMIPHGIKCDQEEKRAEWIVLPNNGLSGSIPWMELSLLEELQALLFTSNPGLHQATFPSSSSITFPNLKMLSLSGVSLQGSIPSSLGVLFPSLEILNMAHNQLTGPLPSFQKLSNLKQLSLGHNLLTGDDVLSALESSVAKSLEELYLEDNMLQFHITIPSFLQNYTNLRQLDFSDNPSLSGSVPVHLFHSLSVLDAHGTNISAFPDIIIKQNSNTTTNLTFLALHDNNNLRGPFPKTITLDSLQHLDLTSTSLTGVMPTELGKCTKLEYLFLADTAFLPGPIPSDYQQLTKLKDFSLKHSGRTGTLAASSDVFSQMNNLSLLDLDSNEFLGTIPSDFISTLKDVQFLMLNRNNLNGTIPSSLVTEKRNLQLLFLNDNSLTGTIPEELSQLENLQLLFLQHNPFLKGTISCRDDGTNNKNWQTDCGVITCPCCSCCFSNNNSITNGDLLPCNDDDDSNGDWLAQYANPHQRDGYNRNNNYGFYDFGITP